MSQSSATGPADGSVSTIVGVLFGLPAAALLFWASVVFVFYGYCEDTCDKPPRTTSDALGAALPSALVALVLLAVACYLFMRRPGARRPSRFKAIVLAVVSSAAFVAGLCLVVAPLGLGADSDAPFLLAMIVFVPSWMYATIALARSVAA
jgi:hypothetical protein